MTATMRVEPLFGEPQPWLTGIHRKRMTFVMVAGHPDWFRAEFMSWLSENWHIWEAFDREANAIWQGGRRHYSARTIGEYLRHQTALRETENEHGWKINDHWWPDLARLYMLMNPDRAGFFHKRSGQSAVRAV